MEELKTLDDGSKNTVARSSESLNCRQETSLEVLPAASCPRETETSSAAHATFKQGELPRRKDLGQPHRVQHGVLSREVLAALTQRGGNPKTYRRLERQFRAALRPSAPWGNVFFDRFWACYLRLMLIGRLEAELLNSKPAGNRASTLPLSLMPGKQPTLVHPDAEGQVSKAESPLVELSPDLLRQLVLAQRYDRHYAREMYRALAVLLLLRRRGEEGLELWAVEILGASKSTSELEGPNDASPTAEHS